MEIILAYPGGPNIISRRTLKVEEGYIEDVRMMGNEDLTSVAGSAEGRREAQAKECGPPWRLEKAR